MRTSIARIIVASSLLSAAMAADIYRCTDSDGNVVYTDVHCMDGVLIAEKAHRPTANATGGLSAAELAALATIQTRLDDQSRRHQSKRQKARKRQQKQRLERQRACEKATAELEAVRTVKRRGYRLSDAPKLETRENRSRQAQTANC